MKTRSTLVALAAASLASQSGAQAPLYHHQGSPSLADSYGVSVGGGRDATGDGVDDYIIGIPEALNAAGTLQIGAVEIYSGATGTLVSTVRGNPLGGNFGISIAMLDDINSDGKAEIAVGADWSLDSGGAAAPGYVRVIDPATGGTLYTLNGAATTDHFALSITAIGDTNADGLDDLVVGAPSTAGPGYVNVYSGLNGTLLTTISSPSSGADFFGYDVARIGTVNGFSTDDILIAAPVDGLVYAWSGFGGATPFYTISDPGSFGFGFSVDSIADTNSDGVDDIVLSAGADSAQTVERVWICSGTNGSLLTEFAEPRDYTVGSGASCTTSYPVGFGANVVNVGDWTGDGRPEIGVTVLNWGGSGESASMVLVMRANGGMVVDSFWGEDSCDGYGAGHALANVGDLDGDSIDDIVIGAANIVSGTVGTGACPSSLPGYANVYLGGQSILTSHTFSMLDANNETQTLVIRAPSFPNQGYWVLGSTSGTMPGTVGPGGSVMPLNSPDPYWNLTLNSPGSTPLDVPIGTLDSNGTRFVDFTLPTSVNWPGSPFVAHAVAIFDTTTGAVLATSNPLPLGIRGTACIP